MKALIFNYHCQNFKEITGYDNNSQIPIDQLFVVDQEIYNKGLNVMIVHNKNLDSDISATLFVDDKNFKQR